jgi:hypothetical protein
MTDEQHLDDDDFVSAEDHGDDEFAEPAAPDTGDAGTEGEGDEDVGPGSPAFDAVAEELMEAPEGEQQAVPGDYKENWTLFFCAVSLFMAALWLPMEGGVMDLTAKDSIAGGFLLISSGCAVFGCYWNIMHRKMLMKPILFAAFIGLYVAALRLFLLFTRRLPELEKQAKAAGETLEKDDYTHLVGSGTWVILFFSLLIFWTLFQSAMSGHKRHKDRQETARADKAAARKAR